MIEIVDVNFQGQPGIIASYVLRGPRGVALIETGPASSYPALKAGLARLGIEIAQVTEVLVTHIHLDHAGAAGWVARESGATVYVHYVGAPHLVDPRRLLASAARIYGDAMGPLWGETLPVPAEQVVALKDGDVVLAAGHRVTAVDTPGHAYHHMAFVLDGLCFTGDVAAVRLPGSSHMRVPTPPPEVDLPLWRRSLERLAALRPDQLLLTHFGPAELSPQDHLATVRRNLERAAEFVDRRRQAGMATEEIVEAFRAWVAEQAQADGAGPELVDHFEIITPSPMLVAGLLRYFSQG
ncbi:MAG: MBL fold metallo-hydrolase [Caldilineales bacterium]|nr:MBL fold metallo-hydrolase [Caldilineales bacterium]MDW8318342.1 MBL fold metallo-hydrolase [Anaerolineae bacterium]